ncbi:SNF2/RAD54 family helicase [Halobaculum sp. EA56]|uniref:SNF2/RAD54 family helicase n=1 Tax=Halobaculum sp. EA56 TaxID=3421648 RepID=UPI003EB6FAF6
MADRFQQLQAGDTLQCVEERAPPAGSRTGSFSTGRPRFTVVVDRVDGDYVEATATTGNAHRRTPDFGDEVALSLATLREDDRWEVLE